MTKTLPATDTGTEITGYAIVAFISQTGQRRIVSLLNELSRELPGMLWTMPPESLHITLLEIIQTKPYSQDKESLYRLHKADYENVPAGVLSIHRPIKVVFDTVQASPQAIIVRGQDGGVFNAIRTQLLEGFPLPAETNAPPDIVHSSIARYEAEAELEKVQEVVRRHSVLFEEEVTEFKLIKNVIKPLLQYEIIRTYPLEKK